MRFFACMVGALASFVFSPPAQAACRVHTAVDPVTQVQTRGVAGGRVGRGIWINAGLNTEATEAYPERALALIIRHESQVDFAVEPGDEAILVLDSGAQLRVPAHKAVLPVKSADELGWSSVWVITYALAEGDLAAIAADPIRHARVRFGEHTVGYPFMSGRSARASRRIACLL